jgi:hypothetical protein
MNEINIIKTEKHPNIDGYVVVTFDDNTTKVLPTTEKVNNEKFIKRPILCDELYMVDDVLSGRKEPVRYMSFFLN